MEVEDETMIRDRAWEKSLEEFLNRFTLDMDTSRHLGVPFLVYYDEQMFLAVLQMCLRYWLEGRESAS